MHLPSRALIVTLGLCSLSLWARAETSVDGYYGSFGTSVPIVVPAFHGLEPELKLVYNSSAGNGTVGNGWSLSAFSVIERQSATRGTPEYTDTDTFSLGGQPLVACTTGSTSPSCTTGGTHSTRIENYNRIKFDGTNWFVWYKDGTRLTFKPIHQAYAQVCPTSSYTALANSSTGCPAAPACSIGWSQAPGACTSTSGGKQGTIYHRTSTCTMTPPACVGGTVGALLGTFQWGLDSVVDVNGNTVRYGWRCGDVTPVQACYPSSITYGDVSITTNWEWRNDYVTFATGSPFSGWVMNRLRSVDVKVGGVRQRAYELLYGLGASGRSQLTSVRQFGSDAVIDTGLGFGAVTSGSSLPALTVKYQNAGTTWVVPSGPSVALSDAAGWNEARYASTIRYPDLNGDGKADVCARGPTGIQCWLSTGSGFSTTAIVGPAYSSAAGWDDARYNSTIAYPDINGDGRSDLCARDPNGLTCRLSTGSGFGATVAGPAWSDAAGWSDPLRYASIQFPDVNGDGKADVCGRDATSIICYLSNGSGFTSSFRGPALVPSTTKRDLQFVDVNGDGMADACARQPAGISCWVSTGAGFSTQLIGPEWFMYSGEAYTGTVRYGDINGDGRADVCTRLADGYHCAVNTGVGFVESFGVLPLTDAAGWLDPAYFSTVMLVDFNEDGRADVCARDSQGWGCWPSNGTSFGQLVRGPAWSDAAGWNDPESYSTIAPQDFTGDGVADLCGRSSAGLLCAKVTVGHERATVIDNGVGATTTVTYKPSTAYPNAYLPVGVVFSVVDTLTTAVSQGTPTSSSVRYGYSGGLWSAAERRFLGFRSVKSVVDAKGNYTETIYHQHDGCIAKPQYTYFRNASGAIYSYTQYDYGENAAPPYTSLLKNRWDYRCELQTSSDPGLCQKILTKFSYDVYGNATSTVEAGNPDVTGDERTIKHGFYPNTAAYVVNRPGFENVYDSTNTLVQQWLALYDNATSYTTPPTKGRQTAKLRWNNKTGTRFATNFTYDPKGNLLTTTDANGHTTTNTFVADQLDTTCDQLGHCVRTTWHPVLKALASQIDVNNGSALTYTYDVFGRVKSRLLDDGSGTTYAYLDWGTATQRTRQAVTDGSANGLWVDAYQDGLGRVYKSVRENGETQLTDYDSTSTRVFRQSAWYAPSTETPKYETFQYDGAGRRQSVTHADQSKATLIYSVGQVESRDELGHVKTTQLDGFGRTVMTRENVGLDQAVTLYSYDTMGRLTQVLDSASNATTATTATYDSLGNKVAWCDPDQGCGSATYDGVGLKLTQTDNKKQTTVMTYDEVNRLKTVTADDGDTTTMNYDESGHTFGAGRLTSVVDSSGSESLQYDLAGRVTSKKKCIGATCVTLAQTYDSASRLKTVKYPNGEVVTYTYEPATGRLASVSGYLTTATYNARDQLLTASYPNGTSETFTYDPSRQWLTTSAVNGPAVSGAAGPLLSDATYAYELTGLVKKITSTSEAASNLNYGYDDLGRLTSVTGALTQTFTYDTLGNMLTNSTAGAYTYGDPTHVHAATLVGTKSYAYDANGDLRQGPGTTRTLEWDALRRLKKVTAGGTVTTYVYDHQGQRVSTSTASRTLLSFDRLYERSEAGATNFIFAGPRLIARSIGAAKAWFHSDHLGSVRLITSSTGAVLNRYRYQPFGAATTVTASATNYRGFGGHLTDPEDGLVYMNARYYDPTLARFISPDSVVPGKEGSQGLNRYSFVFNNPISNIDPSGHVPVAVALYTALTVAAEYETLAFFALAATAAGYTTHNEFLSSVGMVLGGFIDGPMAGIIAAASSPLSPLNPRVKEAIGWAYVAYNLIDSRGVNDDTLDSAHEVAKEVQPVSSVYPSDGILVAGDLPPEQMFEALERQTGGTERVGAFEEEISADKFTRRVGHEAKKYAAELEDGEFNLGRKGFQRVANESAAEIAKAEREAARQAARAVAERAKWGVRGLVSLEFLSGLAFRFVQGSLASLFMESNFAAGPCTGVFYYYENGVQVSCR